MANDPAPAPVPMSLARRLRAAGRRFTLAVALLVLAAPLFGLQQGDPSVAAQDLQKECQRIFLTCASACAGVEPVCRLCEDERKLCRAGVYSNTGVPNLRLPGIEQLIGPWTVFVPLVPGADVFKWRTPRPYPASGPIRPTRPTRPTSPPPVNAPAPPGQEADHCDPDNYDQILQRYRNENGAPSADDLLKEIADEIAKKNERIRQLQQEGYVEGLRVIGNDSDAKRKELENAELTRDFLRGAAKLIEEMRKSGRLNEQALIALKLAMDRALDENRGLTDRGSVANVSVWLFGSDAAVIRDGAPSYHDKQNALARILARYAAGEGLWGIDDDDPLAELLDLADITARESLVAACRAEGMGPSPNGAGGEGAGECDGVRLTKGQCCTQAGIGTVSDKEIAECPGENRSPKPKPYVPKRNGCGTDWTDIVSRNLSDNPNGRLIPGVDMSYYGPSFYPACDFHDDCWGTCNTPETGMNNEVCNSEFGERMVQICDAADLSWVNRMNCRFNAFLYQKLVSGAAAFLGSYAAGQADACDCCEGGAS